MADTCVVCDNETSIQDGRCTNGCCRRCHWRFCTPGGATSPGHGLDVEKAKASLVDVEVRGEGSIYLLTPQTASGKAWVEDHLPEDRQTFGRGVVVEHRYIRDIVDGILGDGLRVNWDQTR